MNLRSVCLVPLALISLGEALGQAHLVRNYDLIDVSYRISMAPRQAMVFGDCTNTLVLQQDAERVAFDFAKLNVGTVTVNGKPATSRFEGEMLWVNLPSRGSKGDRLKVRIVYSGQPEAGMYFVPAERAYPATTAMVYTQGEAEDTRYWLPTYDYPDDKATSEAWIEVPRDWNVIGNGRLVDTAFDTTNKVYHWKMDQPHSTYLNSIVAGPYVEGRENWDSLPVSYFVPPGLEKEGKVAFGGTAEMVAFYSKLTGLKYPYAKFAQSTVADYMFGGMENITAVTQTIGTLHPESAEPLASSKGLVLHELAHQWFGDTITCHDWSHIWLNEGFATFLPHFWFREHMGQDAYELMRYDTIQGALGAMAGEPRPMVFDKYEIPMDNFDGHAYPGGATRMFMLMDLLGEKTFWESIKAFLNQYKFQSVTTEQFFDSVSKTSHRDLHQFMKQWFYTAAMPVITLTRSENGYTIALPEGSSFELNVPIWIWQDGRWLKSKVALSHPVQLNDAKGLVLVDPEVKVAANLTYNVNYTDEEWLAMYQNLNHAGGKARLISFFQASGRQPILVKLVDLEKSKDVLPRLINACMDLPDDVCIRLLNNPDPFVKQAVLNQIAKKGGNMGAAARLRVEMAKEQNSQLKLQEFSAIYSITRDAKMLDEAWATTSWQDSYRSFALERWFASDKNTAREKCLEVLARPTTESLRVNAIGKLGSLKDKPGERRVYDALIKVVQENSFGARNTAVSALAEYGDKAALPYIEPLTKHSLFFISRNAKAAVARLK